MNVFEKTEPLVLNRNVDQIGEIRNVIFRVLRERHLKYFDQNRQQELFESLLKFLLTFSRRSNNEYMNIHIFLPK